MDRIRDRFDPSRTYLNLRLIKTAYFICGAALLLASCSTVAPISPTGPNLLDTLPNDHGMIPVAETDRLGLVNYQGDVKAVQPAEQTLLVQGWVLSRRIIDPAPGPRLLAFTILPNTKITRSRERSALKELKPGERVNILAQPRPDGRLLTVSVAFGKPRGYPVATEVPGRPGWVYSPYAPSAAPVDVSGAPRGRKSAVRTRRRYSLPLFEAVNHLKEEHPPK